MKTLIYKLSLEKHRTLLFFVLAWIGLSLLLQPYRYHFFFTEQLQMFMFERLYLSETFFRIGGAGRIIADFIAQFFLYPYVGVVTTAFVLALAGGLAFSLLRTLSGWFWAGLIMLALLLMHLNDHYFIQGTAGYIFTLLALRIFNIFGKPVWKITGSVALALALYFLFGSVAILFAVCILVKERSFYYVLPVIAVATAAYISTADSLRYALLPDMYYNQALQPSWLLYASWCLLVISLSIRIEFKKRYVQAVIQALIIVVVSYLGLRRYDERDSLKMKELDYCCRMGHIARTIELCSGAVDNYAYLVYLNMALAKQGKLAERMFDYNQRGVKSLFLPIDFTRYSAMLTSEVYYTVGHASASRRMAYEANLSVRGGRSGRSLQRLVETNIICGDYQVAEKYIRMLERTLGYRQWAAKQRKYLYDDKAVEDFQPYGLRRKSLPSGDNLFSTPLQAPELVESTVLNPANRAPIEYAGAMYLLNKDLDAFEELIGNYYGSPPLPRLPTSFQEAAIILNEAATPEEFAKRGVTREVIARFARFKQLYLQNRKSPNLSSLMKREFGKTYWYYFTFVITD